MKSLTTARAALAVAALMLASACGGGGGGGLSDTPQATGAAAPTAGTGGGARTTLKMLETPGGPLSFVSYGVQKGFFAEEGIDLQVSPNPGGGTASIPRRIGRHRAAHLALSGRPVGAAVAFDWGLVDAVDDAAFPDPTDDGTDP